jgi:hypothetical protein
MASSAWLLWSTWWGEDGHTGSSLSARIAAVAAAYASPSTPLERRPLRGHTGEFLHPRGLEGEDDQDEQDQQGDEDAENQENEENQENDEQEEQQEEQEDEEQEEENEQQDNDENNEKNEQNDEMEMEQDDFFEDNIADDAVADNNIDRQYRYDDDFYAFDGDPYPTKLFPLQSRYIVGYAISFMGLLLGASGGIGGGGIAVPVYLLVSGLSPKTAMGVGSVTILGGTMASTYINISRRHPLADRPLIDWDLVLVMQPVVLIGVFLGTFFHQILADHALVVMLVILLSITAHTTLGKAVRMFRAEVR